MNKKIGHWPGLYGKSVLYLRLQISNFQLNYLGLYVELFTSVEMLEIINHDISYNICPKWE